MPYVQRDENGALKGVYANLQEGYAEEFLADDNAEVVAYLAPPEIAQAAIDNGAALDVRQMSTAKDDITSLADKGDYKAAITKLLDLIQ